METEPYTDTPETDRRIIPQPLRMCGCGYKSEIVFADFARRLERERDRLLKNLNILAYWRDISECDCNNQLPNGGCLRCDLDKVFNSNNQNDRL